MDHSSILLFEESVETYTTRSLGLGLNTAALSDAGSIRISHLDPAEISPGQIAHLLVRQVEEEDVKVVVIDTLNGYLQSAVDEPAELLHIHELISYLSRRQVMTLLLLTQHGIIGPDSDNPVNLSFLADNVFLLRYFETEGTIRKALAP